MTRRSAALCAAVAPVVLVVALGGCGSADPVVDGTPTSALSSTPTPEATAGTTSAGQPGTPTGRELGPPFVAMATWVRGSGGRSLHVVPTAAGRLAQEAGDAEEAWREVVRLAPDADQPGMHAQFDCHWAFVRLVQPDKPSWNLEPWRPVVSQQQLVEAGCNPGGPESADG